MKLADNLKIIRVTRELQDEAVEVLKNNFLKYGNISIALDVLGCERAIKESEALFRYILQDDISFAVRDCKTQKMVAVCANKILNPSAGLTLDCVVKEFKTTTMLESSNALKSLKNTINIFDAWHIDCVFELSYFTTHPDYAGKGIGSALVGHSIEFAKLMLNGSRSCNDLLILPPHVRYERPRAVWAIFTSFFSQQIGKNAGFQIINKLSNNDIIFRGRPFAEYIDSVHKFSTFETKRL